MKGVILVALIISLTALAGCQTAEQPEFQYKDDDTSKPTQKEESFPTEGTIEFSTETQTTLLALDTDVNVEMEISGKIDYKIDEKGIMRGSGKGEADLFLSTDIGIAECTGVKNVPIEYSVTGAYDKESNNIAFLSHDTKPTSTVVILDCPSEFSGDLTYDLTLPVLFFVDDGVEKDLFIEHKDGAIKDITITHPVPDWDVEIQAKWRFKTLIKYDEFDFDIDVDPAIVEVAQGGQVDASVSARLIRGKAQDVVLTVTTWPSINAYIVTPTVTPTETTTLTIETTCDTAPDTYLYTVRGETSGTFKTSVDSVSVVVTKNPAC